jgi:uncharacterized membrane protein
MQLLPTTPGLSSQAFAINDRGQVLGVDFGLGGVIWDLVTGTKQVVPDPAGLSGINNLGQIVGSLSRDKDGAFIWDESLGKRFLSDLIPSGTGWELDYAFAINDAGDIVGYGDLNGQVRGFLMTPVPEPAAWSLFAAGALGLLACRRRFCRR